MCLGIASVHTRILQVQVLVCKITMLVDNEYMVLEGKCNDGEDYSVDAYTLPACYLTSHKLKALYVRATVRQLRQGPANR